jgi:hypothetical protein
MSQSDASSRFMPWVLRPMPERVKESIDGPITGRA